MRKFLALILTPVVLVAGCGGSGTSTMSGTPPPPQPPPSQTIAKVGPPNVEGLVLDGGPTSLSTPAVNTAFISVTLCIPGTNTCQTVDHVEVDTGSSGLRILADATITPTGTFSLNLPAALDSSNHPLAECLQFVDGTSWGAIRVANITLPDSGESATNINVHVIGDASVGGPKGQPASCTGSPENTVNLFGANGILGVGPFINDCNSNGPCVPQNPPIAATYYTCPSATTCTTTTATQAQQLQNPATLLVNPTTKTMTDTNGVIIELPPVPANGAPPSAQPVGSLVFGIGTGTQGNNALGSATKLPVSGYPTLALVTATINGMNYPNSYLDSGSNANFFPTSIPQCVPSGNVNALWLCPTSTTNVNATLQGSNGAMAAADFSVANATALFSVPSGCPTTVPCYVAFSNLAAASSDNTSVDLGLSFFYGRNVFTGFEVVASQTPPYFAY